MEALLLERMRNCLLLKQESVEMLRPTGAAIGLVEEAEFAEKTIELQKDDLLVLYTDGITEAVSKSGIWPGASDKTESASK